MKNKTCLEKAKQLRENGHSYNEISKILKISKSTASLWLRGVKMNKKGIARFKGLILDSQEKSKKAIAKKNGELLDFISQKCTVLKENKYFSKNDCKLFLSLLYWCEGAKMDSRLVFINSDPEMIQIYLSLLRKAFDIDENKLRVVLHLHSYHKVDVLTKFWTKITGIDKNFFSIYKKENNGIRKKDNYKGCVSIRYGNTRVLKEVFLIIRRFIDNKNLRVSVSGKPQLSKS